MMSKYKINCPECLENNYKYLSSTHKSRRFNNYSANKEFYLTVADTNFKIPLVLREKLAQCVMESDFSYTFYDDKIWDAVNNAFIRWYNLKIAKDCFIYANGVVQLIQNAIYALTNENDGIIVQVPAYPPFMKVVKGAGRKLVKNELVYDANTNQYVIDFDKLEAQMSQPNVTAMILCHPHNPISRAWKKEELVKIVELSHKHNVYIFSDEIWHQFDYSKKHCPILKCSDKTDNLILFSSPAKDFNVGGAQVGYCFTTSPQLTKKIANSLANTCEYNSNNCVSANLMIECHNNPIANSWLTNYINYCQQCSNEFAAAVNEHTKIKVVQPQATYLVWLRFHNVVKDINELNARLNKIKVIGEAGSIFKGIDSELCLRLMIAIAPDQLERLINAFINEFK